MFRGLKGEGLGQRHAGAGGPGAERPAEDVARAKEQLARELRVGLLLVRLWGAVSERGLWLKHGPMRSDGCSLNRLFSHVSWLTRFCLTHIQVCEDETPPELRADLFNLSPELNPFTEMPVLDGGVSLSCSCTY